MKRFGFDYYEHPEKYQDLQYYGNEGLSTREADWVYNDGGTIHYLDGVNTGFKNTSDIKVYNLYG